MQANDIVHIAARELATLRDASSADIELAKQALKGRINRSFASTARRLEERTKSLYYLGSTNEDISSQIDNVSASQVAEAITNSLRSKLTFVARGGEVNTLATYDAVSKLFN
jgi:predicted Zn-dependent peptidase